MKTNIYSKALEINNEKWKVEQIFLIANWSLLDFHIGLLFWVNIPKLVCRRVIMFNFQIVKFPKKVPLQSLVRRDSFFGVGL
jgi:hypothetical protein